MASLKWDAYNSLNFTSRGNDGMTCVGLNRYGKRCRWDIEPARYRDICAILDKMEKRPPIEAIDSLVRLAELSLCRDFHQNQADRKVREWRSIISEVSNDYEADAREENKIRDLEKRLAKNDVELERLQRRIQETQAQASAHGELEAKIEKLRAQVQQEKAKAALDISVSGKALLKLEKKVATLEEEKATVSRNLAAEKQSLELIVKQYQKSLATCSQLSADLSTKSAEFQQSISDKDQTIERITTERDKLRAEIDSLHTQFAQVKGQIIPTESDEITLCKRVEDMLRNLEAISKANEQYRSDFAGAQSRSEKLSQEVDDLRSQLSIERQKTSDQVLELQGYQSTMGNEIKDSHQKLEDERRKHESLTIEMASLTDDRTTLSHERDTLRANLESEKRLTTQLRDELSSKNQDISIAKETLSEAEANIEKYQKENIELKALATQREKDVSSLITMLAGQVVPPKRRPSLSRLFNSIKRGKSRSQSTSL